MPCCLTGLRDREGEGRTRSPFQVPTPDPYVTQRRVQFMLTNSIASWRLLWHEAGPYTNLIFKKDLLPEALRSTQRPSSRLQSRRSFQRTRTRAFTFNASLLHSEEPRS